SDHGYDFELLRGVMDMNVRQKNLIADQANKMLEGLKDPRIGILGLAFKPNTDDMRDAPALDIIPHLKKDNRKIVAFDPVSMDNAKKLLPDGIEYVSDPYEVCEKSDLVVVLTEWDEIRWLEWRRVKEVMKRPVVYDTRNCLDPQNLRRLGFTYQGVGR
ncbi:MAG: UDP-glucose/GDP-mannose dehydrogenase family protein, partial [Actinomycetia bacterium]|nr:UDP-glucose/GDP-mannose dehydrogenase family protein [Actinomycetes bacterium]